MKTKIKNNGHICIIARNKKFFRRVCNLFKKAEFEYVNVTNLPKADCDKKGVFHCDLRFVVATLPERSGSSGNIPIVAIGGSEDINTLVKLIKKGVFDFVESVIGESDNIRSPVVVNKSRNIKTDQFDEYAALTLSEREILHQIMKGKSNRQIADNLHRSIRTIEDHRNHIMRKVKAENLVDLVKKCMAELPIAKKTR